MKRVFPILLVLPLACGVLAHAQSAAPPELPSAEPSSARVIAYGEKDVVPVNTKIRYTTLIVLPKQESILDYACGDKEFWVVNGTANLAYVKPAKTGAETNLNLITASGNVYSFVLREVSEIADTMPDLKIFVEPRDESVLSAISGTPQFIPAAQVDDYRQQVQIAREQVREAQSQAQATIEQEVSRIRSEYPTKLQYKYRFQTNDKVFRVAAIYNDGTFTYIHASPQEVPAIYEMKDGKPNLIEFQFRDGIFVIPKMLSSGYLAIGKKKFDFIFEE